MFILFFLLAAVVTTVFSLPATITDPIKELSKFFIVMAMAAIGMKCLLLAVVFLSCFYASDELTVIMDILLAVCAFFSTFIMLKLARRGLEAFRDYRAQKKAGVEEPVFHKSCLSDDSGVSSWD